MFGLEARGVFLLNTFFNKFLLKRRWNEKYDETLLLLRDKCNCEIVRETIGKKKITVTSVKEFIKQENVYRPKQFKPKDVF